MSSCFQVSSSWRECSPTPSVSAQQPTEFTSRLLGAHNAQQRTSYPQFIKTTDLIPGEHKTATNPHPTFTCSCVSWDHHLYQLGDPLKTPLQSLPSLLAPISPDSTSSWYWAKLIPGKMKMKEKGLGRNYGSETFINPVLANFAVYQDHWWFVFETESNVARTSLNHGPHVSHTLDYKCATTQFL